MKKNIVAMGLFLTILLALLGGSVGGAYAKDKDNERLTHTPMNDGEPGQSRNQRHRTPNSTRKAAAMRLKAEFKQTKAEEIANDREEHVRGQDQKGDAK
jgi:hypothetical protein